jgi:aryl-alcohol dehydrogenase-like predicted oxidoreductase
MLARPLGSTGILISPISFGAGPISQLLIGDRRSSQVETIARAVELGVNWFDTAATYGDGRSEENLGHALADLGLKEKVHLATKVRIMPHDLPRIAEAARLSLATSLKRLRRERVTLLQVHNSITSVAEAQPTSLTPAHILSPGGLLETMDKLRQEGLVEHLGITGLGEPPALKETIESGAFATIQTPYHLLNASAGRDVRPDFADANYGNVIAACQRKGMGVFVIRVFAGGALAGKPPSPHTFKTPFFPLDLYHRDCAKAGQLGEMLPPDMRREEAAVRFALSHPSVTSAIIGFASPAEVAEAVSFAYRGPLEADLLQRLTEFAGGSNV